jgi:hypothetical protein
LRRPAKNAILQLSLRIEGHCLVMVSILERRERVQSEAAFWTPERQALWARIRAYPLGAKAWPEFGPRLAREQRWPPGFARQAIEEYRRFCFLALVSPTAMTPSEEVDEVWHLHLFHTRDYWGSWCGEALGRPLHHDPAAGGDAAIMREQYGETLLLYERYFGPSPESHWPATRRRFGKKPRFRLLPWLWWRPGWRRQAAPNPGRRPAAGRFAGDGGGGS